MMTRSKKYLFRLILLAAFLVPLSIDKGQSMNLNLGSTHLNFKQSSFSSKKTIAHPRKKTKKKHKIAHIYCLDLMGISYNDTQPPFSWCEVDVVPGSHFSHIFRLSQTHSQLPQ